MFCFFLTEGACLWKLNSSAKRINRIHRASVKLLADYEHGRNSLAKDLCVWCPGQPSRLSAVQSSALSGTSRSQSPQPSHGTPSARTPKCNKVMSGAVFSKELHILRTPVIVRVDLPKQSPSTHKDSHLIPPLSSSVHHPLSFSPFSPGASS